MRTDTASEKLHLVYATDRGYRFLAMVSAKSAICKASQPERLVVHLLDCGLTDEDWATFSDTLRKGAEAVEVRRHQVSPPSSSAASPHGRGASPPTRGSTSPSSCPRSAGASTRTATPSSWTTR